MQVTETLSDGLKRSYKVVLPMQDLAQRLESELSDMKGKVRINGFRPGKVPMEHLRKMYGRQVMTDVLQNAVNDANKKIVEENSLKLANEPHIDIEGGEEGVKKATGQNLLMANLYLMTMAKSKKVPITKNLI